MTLNAPTVAEQFTDAIQRAIPYARPGDTHEAALAVIDRLIRITCRCDDDPEAA